MISSFLRKTWSRTSSMEASSPLLGLRASLWEISKAFAYLSTTVDEGNTSNQEEPSVQFPTFKRGTWHVFRILGHVAVSSEKCRLSTFGPHSLPAEGAQRSDSATTRITSSRTNPHGHPTVTPCSRPDPDSASDTSWPALGYPTPHRTQPQFRTDPRHTPTLPYPSPGKFIADRPLSSVDVNDLQLWSGASHHLFWVQCFWAVVVTVMHRAPWGELL